MAAKKKDLQGAITRGADRFFSVNDNQQEATEACDAQQAHDMLEAQCTHEAHDEQLAHVAHDVHDEHDEHKPYKAQEATKEQLESLVSAMQAQIEAAEARRTQGRKGLKMPKMNMSFTPSNMDYLKVMAGLKGISVTRFVNDIIEQHAAANAERYQKAKELVQDE